MNRPKTIASLLSMFVASAAFAQLADENVLVPDLPGYHVDYRVKNSKVSLVEMTRDSETVHDWTELVTAQTYFSPTVPTAAGFLAAAQHAADQLCPGNVFSSRLEGTANGYPFVQWTNHCPTDSRTGKTEWTIFKAIRGKDALYVVQKGFRFDPSDLQLREAADFLARVTVCDARDAGHPCGDLRSVLPP